MSSDLVAGKTIDQACEAVANKAYEQMIAGDAKAGVWTVTGKSKVMVGIARRDKPAFAFMVDKSEYRGLEILRMLEANP